jgi:TolA-binding protein
MPLAVARRLGFAGAVLLLAVAVVGCHRGRLADLEKQYAELAKKVDEQQQALEAFQVEMDQANEELAKNTAAVDAAGEKLDLLVARAERAAPTVSEGSIDSAAEPTGAGSSPKRVMTAQALHAEGASLLKKRQFNRAILVFEELVALYPQSDLADDALMGEAESFVARKDYRRALDTYTELIRKYPKGDQTAAAALAAGECYESTGEIDQAKKVYEELRDRYAGSTEAETAADRLDRLEQSSAPAK